jgi:hypothetical protein
MVSSPLGYSLARLRQIRWKGVICFRAAVCLLRQVNSSILFSHACSPIATRGENGVRGPLWRA